MALPSGTRLGNYEFTALLGRGEMGEVYRARDPRLGRNVALRLLPVDVAADRERVGRLQRDRSELTFAAATDSWPALMAASVPDGRLPQILALPTEEVGERAPSPRGDVIACIAATTSGPATSRVGFVDSNGRPVYEDFPLPSGPML